MLTEAEQLALDRARRSVKNLFEMVLSQMPDRGDEFGTPDIVCAAMVALGGHDVKTYMELVRSHAETKAEMEGLDA